MPRINIEEKWWSDPRRAMLIISLGLEADAAMLNAIKLSQDFNGEPFDPIGVMPNHWIQALCSVGLATAKPEGLIYVKGAKEHHDWIKTQRERASKGGKARMRNINNIQQATAKQLLKQPPSPLPLPLPLLEPTTSEIQKFEDSFNPVSPEIVEAVSSIYKQFKQTVPKDVRRNLVKIKNHFETRESFANWSNEIFELNKGARQYTVALLKEIGAFN